MILLKKSMHQRLKMFYAIQIVFVFLFVLSGCSGEKENQKKKMILSFYLDDTSPGIASAESLKIFLDFCKANGVMGESTVVLGYDGESMAVEPDSIEKKFLEYAAKSYESGIDTHMEIMTHHELFDF